MIIMLNLYQAKAVNHIWESISWTVGRSHLLLAFPSWSTAAAAAATPFLECNALSANICSAPRLPRLRFAVKPKNLDSCQTLESTRWVRQGGGRRRELGLSFPTIGISFRVQCPLTPPPLTAIICSVWTFNSPWGLFGFYHGTTIFVLKGISLLVQSSGFSRALPSSFYTCIPHP